MSLETNVTPAVVQMLTRAQEEARALGHGCIGTEHLLIAIASGDSAGATALRAHDADVERVRAEVARIFDENSWNRYVPDEEALAAVGVDAGAVKAAAEAEFGRGAVEMRAGNPGFTKRVVGILEAAIDRARVTGNTASVEDVLRAVLESEESVAARVLERLRVDPAAVRAAIR